MAYTCRVGFCGIFEHFLASGFSYSQAESTPAHPQVTQTVGHFAKVEKSGFLVLTKIESMFYNLSSFSSMFLQKGW